jgi:hypothetical protein
MKWDIVHFQTLSQGGLEKWEALFSASTDKENDFAYYYGTNNSAEDFATIFEAWAASSFSLLEKAVNQERTILLQKMLIVIDSFTFKGENGREYVYIYKQDELGNISRDSRLIMRDEEGNIVGIDINGDGVIAGDDEDFRGKLGLPPQTDQAQKEVSQYKIDSSNFDFLPFRSNLDGSMPHFEIEAGRNNFFERFIW